MKYQKYWLLEFFQPDEKALWGLIREHIDEGMLREVAELNHGAKADDNYVFLRRIMDSGNLAALVESGARELEEFRGIVEAWRSARDVNEQFRWYQQAATFPGFWRSTLWVDEVLEICSYGERKGEGDSWKQMFSCWVYLQKGFLFPVGSVMAEDRLLRFVAVAIELGDEVSRASASFLAWLFVSMPEETGQRMEIRDRAILAFSILLLSAHGERRAERGPWMKRLAVWVEAVEARASFLSQRRFHYEYVDKGVTSWGPDCWLFGPMTFTSRQSWLFLNRAILRLPHTPHLPELESALGHIGGLLPEEFQMLGSMGVPSLESDEVLRYLGVGYCESWLYLNRAVPPSSRKPHSLESGNALREMTKLFPETDGMKKLLGLLDLNKLG